MAFIRTAGIAPILSITLILFVIGLMGKFLIYAYHFEQVVREDIGLHVFLKDGASQEEIDDFRKELVNRPEVIKEKWVSKDDALAAFIAEGNEDPTRILDYNPLPASIHVFVADVFSNKEDLATFQIMVEKEKIVQEVRYSQNFVEQLNQNVRRIAIVMLGVLGLLFFICIILIDNTIRLVMLHNRKSIKTMQFAGATNWFIAFPYIRQGIIQGMWSGVLSVLLLLGAVYYLEFLFDYLAFTSNQYLEWLLYGGLLLTGTLIALLSTRYSVYKHLKTSAYRFKKD